MNTDLLLALAIVLVLCMGGQVLVDILEDNLPSDEG